MSDRPYVEPSHLLPDEDWRQVVAYARKVREEIMLDARGGAASGIAPIHDMTAGGVASGKFFPVSGIPTQLLVLHSGECPLKGGYARSLSNWTLPKYPNPPIASWTWFVDPLEIVALIPPHLGAWHASEANNLSEGFEQAGYARFSRAEWLTPDGLAQMESLAWLMAQRAIVNNIPARWLTNAEVTRATNGDRSVKGLCLHRQIDPETRTDPGDGYPLDLLLQKIQFYMKGGTTPPPIPEEDDMPLSDADVKKIWQLKGSRDGKTIWSDVVETRNLVVQQAATINALVPLVSAGTELTQEQITEAIKLAFVDLIDKADKEAQNG